MNGQLSAVIDKRHEHGPFDIIGDVHGCFSDLTRLLVKLNYVVEVTGEDSYLVTPPQGRRAVFLGDLVDRGPEVVSVLKLVLSMVKAGSAFCVAGNHDMRVLKKLREGVAVTSHGSPDWGMLPLMETGDGFRAEIQSFLEGLVGHYVFDDGKLVVAHAGIREDLQGRETEQTRAIAIGGEITGETDEYGLPVRYDWAADYCGRATVIYGHTPFAEVQKCGNAINLDTGCVFGGKLTAFRYPEGEFVAVTAAKMYCPPAKPFLPAHAGMPNFLAWRHLMLQDGVLRTDI